MQKLHEKLGRQEEKKQASLRSLEHTTALEEATTVSLEASA